MTVSEAMNASRNKQLWFVILSVAKIPSEATGLLIHSASGANVAEALFVAPLDVFAALRMTD
jgi:hypothetical protein